MLVGEFEGNKWEIFAEDRRTYYVTYYADRDLDQWARLTEHLRSGPCSDKTKTVAIFGLPREITQVERPVHGISGTME